MKEDAMLPYAHVMPPARYPQRVAQRAGRITLVSEILAFSATRHVSLWKTRASPLTGFRERVRVLVEEVEECKREMLSGFGFERHGGKSDQSSIWHECITLAQLRHPLPLPYYHLSVSCLVAPPIDEMSAWASEMLNFCHPTMGSCITNTFHSGWPPRED